ncbi:hypothetical protein N7475_000620 [Penicillium sp. IBT 31633x]|nr:hypothetical protein N7475_000620 [Penicillium sp. IBT 31633x]
MYTPYAVQRYSGTVVPPVEAPEANDGGFGVLENHTPGSSGTEARLFRLAAGGNVMRLTVWSTLQRDDL